MGLAPPPAGWLEQSQPPAPDVFYVWPVNWPAMELFMRCQSQWRPNQTVGESLDYGALLEMGKLYEVKNLPQVIEDVQVIEYTIIAEREG